MQDTVVSQHIQDAFILLAIQDTGFLRAARGSVKPEYFGSQVTENLIKICYDFFDQFHVAPQNHFRDEVVRMLREKDSDKVDLYLQYMERIQEMDHPNTAYVISRINKFVQARELEKGTIRVVQLAKDGQFEKARNVMQSMLRAGIIKEEVGLRYFNLGLPTYLQPHRANERLMGIGMEPIDSRFRRGLCRTDFVCLLGGYKGKKSWACVYLGTQALLNSLNVLHITHELSLEDTEKRYDQSLGGLAGSLEYPTENITIEDIGDDGEVQSTEVLECPTVRDVEQVQTVRRRVGRLGGQLIIRKYPMGCCSMDEVVRYLDYLETFEGYVPDVIINDYIEKMWLPPGPGRRDHINDYYIRSKGIADDRKLLMVTVSQVTRDALRKRKLDQKDFAEDIRKLGNVDLVFAISQTDAQAQNNRMLMWMMANRHGPMDYGCMFNQNLDIGQFCLKSWPLQSTARQRRQNATQETSE